MNSHPIDNHLDAQELQQKLQQRIDYEFEDKALLEEALTHSSCKLRAGDINNERLEFLGDTVLNLVITEELYLHYRKSVEGKLSSMRSKLVSTNAISSVGLQIEIQNALILSNGEEKNGGRANLRNIENGMEALIGAIYLDGGLREARRVILELWRDLIDHQDQLDPDAKSTLQEWSQKYHGTVPTYKVISTSGSSHAPIFEISVSVVSRDGMIGPVVASGQNKKEAEKLAALKFIESYVNP